MALADAFASQQYGDCESYNLAEISLHPQPYRRPNKLRYLRASPCSIQPLYPLLSIRINALYKELFFYVPADQVFCGILPWIRKFLTVWDQRHRGLWLFSYLLFPTVVALL